LIIYQNLLKETLSKNHFPSPKTSSEPTT